jgi:hypothetical protein
MLVPIAPDPLGEHMTTAPIAHTDVLVLDYLAALWAESDDLDPDLRDELMTTVADYIAFRRGSAAAPLEDPADVIRRLGPPEALVAACRRGRMPLHLRLPALLPPPAAVPVRSVHAGGPAEYTAIGLLTAGAVVLPGIAPLAGILLATGSPHWTAPQKAAAWAVSIGSGAAGLMMALFFAAAAGISAEFALFVIYVVMTGGSLLAGKNLLDNLRRPAAGGPPAPGFR